MFKEKKTVKFEKKQTWIDISEMREYQEGFFSKWKKYNLSLLPILLVESSIDSQKQVQLQNLFKGIFPLKEDIQMTKRHV